MTATMKDAMGETTSEYEHMEAYGWYKETDGWDQRTTERAVPSMSRQFTQSRKRH